MRSQKPQIDDNILNNARRMRRQPSDAEQRLWYLLRNRQLGGFKFRRQHPVGPYIIDFFCSERSFGVEVDGEQHALGPALDRDQKRTKYLNHHGIRIVRFWTGDVVKDLEGTARKILRELSDDSRNSPSPYPLPMGEE